MHYPLSASPPKRKGVKAHCVHLISKLGGPLLLNLASDIRRGVWKRRTQFGIKYSEYSIMSAILSYWKFLRLYHYLNRLSGSVDYSCKYIVYYLQFEPEATTQVRCTLKSQLIAIKMLSQALPKGWTLYVKEHPHQFLLNKENIGFDYYIPSVNKYKNKIYYDKIASMDHTVLVAQKCHLFKLINMPWQLQLLMARLPSKQQKKKNLFCFLVQRQHGYNIVRIL